MILQNDTFFGSDLMAEMTTIAFFYEICYRGIYCKNVIYHAMGQSKVTLLLKNEYKIYHDIVK